MAIATGTKLGPYEITGAIGAGGMGEVYRARDSKLGRDVAIKVLPAAFARDAERMARFQREAKVLASLNHPNIATIHGLEDSGSTHALVMELVEGPTLADRIKQGPIPTDESLRIAKQICEALEYAHERGIVHRDLKPANVKVTSDDSVKVLDFGLAKAVEGDASSIDVANSPTMSRMATMQGVLLGTAAYMSPEQAKGKTVDRRADIWAFGCVLYEMLTGKQPFRGESVIDTLAAVTKEQPDWTLLPKDTPTPVRMLLQRCLQKDAKQRLRDIGDARISLDEVLAGAPEASSVAASPAMQGRLWLAWGVAALLFVTSASLAFVHFRKKPLTLTTTIRFQIPRPEETTPGLSEFAVSPDGRRLVYATAGSDGVRGLWLRNLDSLETKPLPGTEIEGAVIPFWSPDSRYVGFVTAGKLKKVDIGESAGQGAVQTICDVPKGLGAGGSWNRDGVILFVQDPGRLMRVSADGGIASTVTLPHDNEINLLPTFLPDGKHFLYLRASRYGATGVYFGSLEAKPEQQDSKQLVASPSAAVYVPDENSDTGQLLFLREGTLFAQPFDSRIPGLTGDPTPIAQGIADVGSWGAFSASENGVLVYVSGEQRLQPVWFDRQGKAVSVEQIDTFDPSGVALSPDATRMAYTGSPPNLWLLDRSRNTKRRLTFGSGVDAYPVWSPDGGKIAYAVNAAGAPDVESDLYQKDASNDRDPELLLKSGALAPTDWSRDGRFLIYTRLDPKTKYDIWVLPLGNDHQPFPLLRTEFNERRATFSPDGHWIAYVSDQSGKEEIYVRPFNPTLAGGSSAGNDYLISTDGGWQVRWRRDGKELFYETPDGTMMSVEVTTSPAFQAGRPTVLFQTQPLAGPTFLAVTADGTRFLVVPQGQAARIPFTVVLNWQAALKK